MKVIRITASKGRTKQFVQFEPTKYYVELRASLAEGDDVQVASKKLFAMCTNLVNDAVERDSK